MNKIINSEKEKDKNRIQSRKFHIGDILSITHDRLVSPRHIEGVYDILDYMTGDKLFTHQLPRAADECKPILFKQFPFLNKIDSSNVTTDNWEDWLKTQILNYGEWHYVTIALKDEHEIKNPITEAIELIGKDKVIVAGI